MLFDVKHLKERRKTTTSTQKNTDLVFDYTVSRLDAVEKEIYGLFLLSAHQTK